MFEFKKPFLIGMVHLPALPGSPRGGSADGCLASAIRSAVADGEALREAGFDALLIENYGDTPFHAERVEPVTVACMSVVVAAVRNAVALPLGINVLRNDARAALGIAVATGASFIRVNVHVGVAATDQGWIEGRADRTLRDRARFGADVSIFADVHVKHAASVNEPDIAQAARDTLQRGHADALIVTGPATGAQADVDALQRVRDAVGNRPILVGSATRPTAANFCDLPTA